MKVRLRTYNIQQYTTSPKYIFSSYFHDTVKCCHQMYQWSMYGDLFFYIFTLSTGCLYKLSRINLVWGPLKCIKSNFNPVHVFLHFKSFCLVVLQLILASKLSEWEQFENFAANYQFRKKKRAKMTQKSDWCHCQAIKRCLCEGRWSPDSKIEF